MSPRPPTRADALREPRRRALADLARLLADERFEPATSRRSFCVVGLGPLARRLPIRIHPPPIEVPAVPFGATFHERWTADPGHRWFRDRVLAVWAEALGDGQAMRTDRGGWPR